MARSRTVFSLLLLLAPTGLPAPSAAAAGGESLPIPDLDRLLAHVAAPQSASPCAVTVAPPEGPPLTASCASSGAASPGGGEPSPGPALTLDAARTIETPRWNAALAPLGGGPGGAFVRVHGYGDVAAMGADGSTLWNRGAMSLYPDWGLAPWIVPFVLLGSSPVNPWIIAGERPYAAGDVTGDGLDDVVVAHWVRLRDLGADGKYSYRNLSVVTVLDGRDGAARWTRPYPGYVTQVLLVDGLLLIGDETGNVRGTEKQGEDGSTTSLHALSLRSEGETLVAEPAWSLSTGKQWARWLSVEPTGEGRIAAAWTVKALGAAGSGGTVLVADAATGGILWSKTTVGYPRTVRYDATRDQVVVHEELDPVNQTDRLDYTLAGYRASDGQPAARLSRERGLLLSLQVDDVLGSAAAEWITGDLEQSPVTAPGSLSGVFVASRVGVADGDAPAGATGWTRRVAAGDELIAGRSGGLSVPAPYGVLAAGPPGARRVLAASLSPFGTGLTALEGATGAVAWDHFGDVAFPLFLLPVQVQGAPAVLAGTSSQVLRAFSVATGATLREMPLLGDVFAAATADVDRDGTTDLIVGGESGYVFALDGRDLDDLPGVLWRAKASGPVRQIEVADLDADGKDEVVVAASSAVDVLRAASGARVYSLAHPAEDFVWTFTVADVSGDDRPDVLVPTRALTAYRGYDGAMLWTFRPPETAAIPRFSSIAVGDLHVMAQLLFQPAGVLGARHHQFAVALEQPDGRLTWIRPQVGYTHIVRLWRSVATYSLGGDRVAVAFTFDAKESGLPTGFWRPRTDVYDARDGTMLYSHHLRKGVVPMGTLVLPNTGLVEMNWVNVAHMTPERALEVQFEATSDVAEADFGPAGRAFLRAWSKVEAFSPDAPLGALGDYHPPAAASWGGFYSGRLLVRDLDRDGADEVVALPFDWDAYATVASWEGTGVGHFDILPHGVAVLEAR